MPKADSFSKLLVGKSNLLYPNPATISVTIQYPDFDFKKVSAPNLIGRIVLTKNFSAVNLK